MNQTARALPSKIEMFSDFETNADTPARSGIERRFCRGRFSDSVRHRARNGRNVVLHAVGKGQGSVFQAFRFVALPDRLCVGTR